MGLFDKLFNEKTTLAGSVYTPKSHQEAFVVIVWLCINADGKLGEIETNDLARMTLLKDYLQGFDSVGAVTDFNHRYFNYDPYEVINSCAAIIPENLKPTLFANVMDMVLSDGKLDPKEEEMSKYLAEKLNLEFDIAKKIVEVLIIKNYGNLSN